MTFYRYHTTAVHGFSGRMFQRSDWYRRIRFDESWFREQLQAEGLPQCPGAFPGICDAAASDWIADRLGERSGAPQFMYWVTLNSHLPVPVPNRVAAAPPCSGMADTGNAAICSWYQLVFNVHRSVAAMAGKMAAKMARRSAAEEVRPTVFLIVGDHAPPFSRPELKERFSGSSVPYVLLVPRDAGGGPVELNNSTGRATAAVTHRPMGVQRPAMAKRERPAHSLEAVEAPGGS